MNIEVALNGIQTSLATAFICFVIAETPVFNWLKDRLAEDSWPQKFLSCYICQTPYVSAIALIFNDRLRESAGNWAEGLILILALSCLASIWCALLDSCLTSVYEDEHKDIKIIITDRKPSEVLSDILSQEGDKNEQ